MRTTIAILLAAALAGCDLTATAEADSICVTEAAASQQVPGTLGSAPVPAGFTLPVSLKVQYDLGAALPDLDEKGISADLPAQSLAVTSPEGADFSGVDSLSLTVSAPGRPDLVFTYTKPAGATGPITSVVARPAVSADLVDYLQGTSITVGSPRFSGRLPSTSWTPTLRTCAGAKFEADYLEAAGL